MQLSFISALEPKSYKITDVDYWDKNKQSILV